MRNKTTAAGLGALCVVVSALAVAGVLGRGWSFTQAVETYVVSNVLIGVSFGLCGALIAYHRPRLPLGWLYAVGGLCQTATALAAPVADLLQASGAPNWLVRLDVTVYSWAWPLNVGVVLPLSLLLLPDGRLPSRRWRPVFLLVAATAPLFVVEIGTGPSDLVGLPEQFGALPAYDDLSWLWTLSDLRWTVSVLVGVVSLAIRYRNGDEPLRRQLLWPLSAASVVLVAVTPFALVAGTPILAVFAIPLLPASIAVAVLRYRLLDIRLVVARAATYTVLSGLVLAVYAGLVVVLSGVASALVVALLALPVRVRLQRAVERLMYGERDDPLRVATRVGGRLGSGLEGTLDEVRGALRLPYVGVTVDGAVVASSGVLEGAFVELPLADGLLSVGMRTGEQRLAAADEKVLRLLAGPLSAALHAMRLSEQLQLARERLVVAREEERRRLRRDLHDGLGPLLTGVALSADAVANLTTRSPGEAGVLLDAVRADSRIAIREVRRIVDDLRPPALDELGLVAALRARTDRASQRADGTALSAVVDAPSALPALPAAIEVAAYRIATEALNNAVRHSAAQHVVVRLTCGTDLSVEVDDDGRAGDAWTPGVGITGMQERAAELGGHCEVGPGPDGGRVRVSLPLVSA